MIDALLVSYPATVFHINKDMKEESDRLLSSLAHPKVQLHDDDLTKIEVSAWQLFYKRNKVKDNSAI